MCMLSYYPENVQPDENRIRNGAQCNRDGYGYAIADTTAGRLIAGKGMNDGPVIAEFLKQRKLHPNGPAIFHSRISTGGGRTLANCHPYKVGRDSQTVLAHNGILFTVPRGETRSDTRIFADQIMPKRFRRLDRPGVQQQIEKYLGGSNKLAVVTVNPRYRHHGYLFGEELGHWLENSNGTGSEWHSNLDYLGRRFYSVGGYWVTSIVNGISTQKWHPYANGSECNACGARHGVTYGICSVCNSCEDCLEDYANCQCYWPAPARKKADKVTAGDSGEWEQDDDARYQAWWDTVKADNSYTVGSTRKADTVELKAITAGDST